MEKIGHGKFSKDEIVNKELDMLCALDFNLMQAPSIEERALLMAEELLHREDI